MDRKKTPKTTVGKCCVPSCQNIRQRDIHLSWHSFPRDPKLCKEWFCRIGDIGKQGPTPTETSGQSGSWQPKKHHKICGMHFNKSGKRGHMDKIPLFFHRKDFSTIDIPMPKNKKMPSKCVPATSTRHDGNLLPLDIGSEVVCPWSSSRVTPVHPPQPQSTRPPGSDLNPVIHTGTRPPGSDLNPVIHTDHNYFVSLEDDDSAILKILEEKTRLLGSILGINTDLEKRNEELVHENRELKNKLLLLESKCSQQEASREVESVKLSRKTFRLSSVLSDAKVVRFYTGFDSGESLSKFLDFVVEGYELKFPANKSLTGRPQSLANRDQIFLVLCRLRLGFREEDLAQRFQISKTTVSKLWNIWAPFLSSYLSSVPSWPGQKQVRYLCTTRLNETIKELQLFRSSSRKNQTARIL